MDRKRQKSNEGKDIMSNLPEQIMSQILSCLPIRDAVRTSVLSKTWIGRWTCVTKLELNEHIFYHGKKKTGKQHFIDFVNRSLLLTESSSVQSFILVIFNKHDPSVVNTWMANILGRRVKKLDLRLDHDLNLSALSSHNLFMKNKYYMEELVLHMSRCAIRIPTPSYSYGYFHFSNLEFLDLSGITFTFHLKDVRLSCPVLKELKTKNCYWLRVKCVTFEVPLLERFSVEHGSSKAVSGEESLNNFAAMIKICSSRLTEFTWGGYMLEDLVFADPSSAKGATANIILRRPKNVTLQETQIRISRLFKQFTQVKCLNLVGTQVLAECKVSLTTLPWMKMLTSLELDLVNGETLLGLLHMSPVIRTLEFTGISMFEKEILNSAAVPKCLLSTLEVVKFGRIHGSEHELCLAKFIVENALVLKRMSFSYYGWQRESKAIEDFKEKLFTFKKGFKCAIIDFHHAGY
ncbi:F-box/LRR-repeat protein At5g38396-like [Arachis stenosperma]|uniref:F-box/LRR-repeat protein At5g38396-like n=1 Tax=Arachis stenosperma TaxID=217475 RepID=UPI0025AC1963|nr:F-box/LRR-repeat protein At5g38396-like [Arachis stenosperma]